MRPFPELPIFTHVSESICTSDHVRSEHVHDVYELCYVLAGKGIRTVDGSTTTIRPGDFYVIRPGEVHSSRSDPRDPYHYFAIGFSPMQLPIADGMARTDGTRSKEVLRDQAGLGILDQRVIPGCAGAERIFRRILTELDRLDECARRKRDLSLIMIQALMVELLVFLSRCTIARAEDVPTAAISAEMPIRSDFQELLRWLHGRLDSPPSLSEMAARMNLSRAHMNVAFKREVGQTPLEYLTGMRIDEACRRLRFDDEASITAIAYDLGFSTSQYFSLVFRKLRGCTPSEWRSRQFKAS